MADHTLPPSLLPDDDREEFGIDTADGADGEDAVDEDGAEEPEGCPFCEEYSGENWQQHAAQAHPAEWAEYKED